MTYELEKYSKSIKNCATQVCCWVQKRKIEWIKEGKSRKAPPLDLLVVNTDGSQVGPKNVPTVYMDHILEYLVCAFKAKENIIFNVTEAPSYLKTNMTLVLNEQFLIVCFSKKNEKFKYYCDSHIRCGNAFAWDC